MSSWSCLLYFNRNNTFVHICENVMSREFALKKKIVFDDVVFGAHEQIISIPPVLKKKKSIENSQISVCYMGKCVYCSLCVRCEFQGLDSKVSLETCFEECSYGNENGETSA